MKVCEGGRVVNTPPFCALLEDSRPVCVFGVYASESGHAH